MGTQKKHTYTWYNFCNCTMIVALRC